MSTSRVTQKEGDILTVIRELESKPAGKIKELPNPRDLWVSLQEKRKLVKLLNGYVKGDDIEEMKSKLSVAIMDLKKILKEIA